MNLVQNHTSSLADLGQLLRWPTWLMLRGPIPTGMRFIFFPIRFGLLSLSYRTRFTPAKPRSRPCAFRNEFAYSTLREIPNANSACPPAQFELLPTSQNLIYKIEVAPNTKIGLFSNKGQLQIILHRIMHSDPKLELRLWKSGLLSWIPLGDTSRRDYSVDWFRSAWLIFSVYRSKRTCTQSPNRTD